MNLITQKNLRFEIQDKRKKERIDIFLTNSIENATRTKVQELIKGGYVKINNKLVKPSYIISSGDVIEVTIPVSPRPEKAEPENIPIKIVYEDQDIIIVNKDAGMVVHPAYSHYTGTLVNALLHHTENLSNVNEQKRAGIIHRLDKDTSGLLVIAKNDYAHQFIAKQFSKRTIDREYWAIVWGIPKTSSGLIEGNIARSKSDRKKFTVSEEGKYAATIYEVIKEYEFLSLLKLKLKTGRTHQIRVHLLSIGHPVFGDPVYNGDAPYNIQLTANLKKRINNLLELINRQALHAKTIGFIHPTTKEFVKFDSDLPDDMKAVLEKIELK